MSSGMELVGTSEDGDKPVLDMWQLRSNDFVSLEKVGAGDIVSRRKYGN